MLLMYWEGVRVFFWCSIKTLFASQPSHRNVIVEVEKQVVRGIGRRIGRVYDHASIFVFTDK
jgi:hypothetical protein